MKTTKKRPVLNEVFKQFQTLPEWPIKKDEPSNLSRKATEVKRRTLPPDSGGRASLLRKFQLLAPGVADCEN